jgi:hypothetical protein
MERREKVYLTVAHFNILMEHRWQKDWYHPRHSGTLVNDHALDLSSIYTSARLSEFLKMCYRVSLIPSLAELDKTPILTRLGSRIWNP